MKSSNALSNYCNIHNLEYLLCSDLIDILHLNNDQIIDIDRPLEKVYIEVRDIFQDLFGDNHILMKNPLSHRSDLKDCRYDLVLDLNSKWIKTFTNKSKRFLMYIHYKMTFKYFIDMGHLECKTTRFKQAELQSAKFILHVLDASIRYPLDTSTFKFSMGPTSSHTLKTYISRLNQHFMIRNNSHDAEKIMNAFGVKGLMSISSINNELDKVYRKCRDFNFAA